MNNEPASQPVKSYLPLISAIVILLFRILYYIATPLGQMTSDSGSYIDYDPALCYRMFGYPLLIDLQQFLFGEHYAAAVCLIQILISTISVYYLYRSLRLLTDRIILCCIITVFYGASPFILQWDVFILSESLSLSVTILFIYHAISWLKTFRKRDAVGMSLCCFWGTIIKTALFVYIAAVVLLLLFVFFLEKEHKKQALFALLPALVVIVFDLAYCGYNYQYCGLFSMSYLNSRHKMVYALRTGTYLLGEDPEINQKIDEIYAANDYNHGYITTTAVMELFGDSWQEQCQGTLAYAKNCLAKDPGAYIKYLVLTVVDASLWKYDATYPEMHFLNTLHEYWIKLQRMIFDHLYVGMLELLSLLSFIVLLLRWIKDRKCPFLLLGLTGGMLLAFISVYLAAYSEWTRLLDYVLSFAYADTALLLDMLLAKKNKSDSEKQ